MSLYIKEIPSVLNGMPLADANRLASEFLDDQPCDETWHAIRALRDFYEWVMMDAVEIPIPHGRLIDADAYIDTLDRQGYIRMAEVPTIIEPEG